LIYVLQSAVYQSNNNNHIYLQRNHYTMIQNKNYLFTQLLKIIIMKTSTFKTVIVMLATLLFVAHLFGQQLPGIRIDVQGSRYSDQVWFFHNSSCTRGFDKGWDALDPDRANENQLAPEILGMEDNQEFHIDVVPDLNETYIGFKAGEDTVYTMTFTNQNLQLIYDQLSLVDLVENKTIDVFNTGAQYTFTAHRTVGLEKRFKLLATKFYVAPVTPPAPTDTIAVVPTPSDTIPPLPYTDNDSISADTTSIDTTVIDTVGGSSQGSQTVKSLPNQMDSHDMKVRVYSVNRTIYINNTDKTSGALSFYNAQTGKVVKNFRYAAQTTTSMQFDGPAGIYIMNGTTGKGQISGKLLIQ